MNLDEMEHQIFEFGRLQPNSNTDKLIFNMGNNIIASIQYNLKYYEESKQRIKTITFHHNGK